MNRKAAVPKKQRAGQPHDPHGKTKTWLHMVEMVAAGIAKVKNNMQSKSPIMSKSKQVALAALKATQRANRHLLYWSVQTGPGMVQNTRVWCERTFNDVSHCGTVIHLERSFQKTPEAQLL